MTDSQKHPLKDWMGRQLPPLTQADAAIKLGVSEPYLSLVISGQRAVSLKRALSWSKITGLSPDDFAMAEAAE